MQFEIITKFYRNNIQRVVALKVFFKTITHVSMEFKNLQYLTFTFQSKHNC